MRTVSSLFAACMFAAAQPVPGSIVTHPLLVPGPSVIDGAGNVYATSAALGGQFVTAGAAQTQYGGGLCGATPGGPAPCSDAVIAKVNSSGTVVFSTYLGGPSADWGNALAIDGTGNTYVTGYTGGSFPTTPGAAIASSTTSLAFAAKLSADGSTFIYSTYLPAAIAGTTGIGVDAQGEAVVVGYTTTNHACVIKLSADGSGFIYSTVLAGSNKDYAAAIAVDAAGNAFVTGNTNSPDFPVSPGVVQPLLAGIQNAFLTKLDPSGNIIFSTYLGGSASDAGNAVQVDAAGNVYVAGNAGSLDFPTTAASFEPAPMVPAWTTTPGGFVAKLSADGSSLTYSSYFPGVLALALGNGGDVYLAGSAAAFFPVTPSAPQPCSGGSWGGISSDFVAHLDAQGALVDATYIEDNTNVQGFGALADGSALVVGEVISQVRFGGAGWIAASCMTPTMLQSATFSGSYAVPGEIVAFAGFGIGPQIGVSASRGAQGIPTMTGGVQVLFDGTPAPVFYAQSGQVNAQVPFEISGQSTTAVTLTYNGTVFGPVNVPVNFAYAGLFRLQANVSAQAYALNQDGTLNSAANPASRGSVVAFWGTGFGATDPACATGGLNAPGPANLVPELSVTMIGGGPVQYAGGAPGLACGISQINMQIPIDKPPGALLVYPQVTITRASGISFVENPIKSVIYIK